MFASDAFVKIRDRVNAARGDAFEYSDMGAAAKWTTSDKNVVVTATPPEYQIGAGTAIRRIRREIDGTPIHEQDVDRVVSEILTYFGTAEMS